MDIGFAYLLHHKLLKKEKKKSFELQFKNNNDITKKYIVCERCGQSYIWCNCNLIIENRDNFLKENKSYKDL
jgi:hypothetical protein